MIGNLMFGYLIDLNCKIPIIIFSASLFSEYFISFRVKLTLTPSSF